MLTPANLLLEFVLSLLVPFLATGPLTDAALARRAAEDTIAAYKAAGQDQLVTIAQLVAFALAALDNLRLSMPADLSLSMKLKLRGNAGTLNRASLHATAALDRQRRDIPPPQRDQQQVLASLEAAKTVVQQALAAQALATATPSAETPPNPAPIAARLTATPIAAATTMAPLVAPLAANANAPSGQQPPPPPSPLSRPPSPATRPTWPGPAR